MSWACGRISELHRGVVLFLRSSVAFGHEALDFLLDVLNLVRLNAVCIEAVVEAELDPSWRQLRSCEDTHCSGRALPVIAMTGM